MKVYVAVAIDIAPDIRLDHGGGEVGTHRLLGVTTTKELAISLTRNDVDQKLAECENGDPEEWWEFDWEDTIEDIIEASVCYAIHTTNVLESSG